MQADDLSRWVLAHPEQFDASDLRCWRIGSDTWLALADERLEPVGTVERPVGLFVVPAVYAEGWQLVPVLSLDAIRLVIELGGRLDRDLCSAVLPIDAVPMLLGRVNIRTLHAGPKECLDSAGQLAQMLSRELRQPVTPGVPADKRDRWGRLLVSRQNYTSASGTEIRELRLRVVTFPGRGFGQRRLGARRLTERDYGAASAVMDLGEAVQTAVERELPLLLSTEAAGHLKDSVRVGRMKGRPGMPTITSSDGVSATTRRLAAEQALAALRKLKRDGASATLDAGARQLVRMTLARPLQDDPVLLGRQQEIAALKVVGSGVDASTGWIRQDRFVGPGDRASSLPPAVSAGCWSPRADCSASGGGARPAARRDAACRHWRRTCSWWSLDDRRQVAGQVRAFDRELGDRPGRGAGGQQHARPLPGRPAGNPLAPADRRRGASLRKPGDRGPPGAGAGALRRGRGLLASDRHPRGKSAEHLDVLVGLAVGDRAMITERLNTREAGDLMDEVNAHRLRVNYGPHLVRVTRQDMQAWMPDVLPAKPLALDPDPALHELLEAIRAGGREAYRRLLEVLRELKRLESGTAMFKQALAELSRVQGVVLGNVGVYLDASRRPRDAHPLKGRAGPGAAAPGARAAGDARRWGRAATPARDRRANPGGGRRSGPGAGVRRPRAGACVSSPKR